MKSILKKLPDTVIKDYLEDEDSPIAGESKKIKKAKFFIESKVEEKDNNYKLRRIQSRKSLKKLVMISQAKEQHEEIKVNISQNIWSEGYWGHKKDNSATVIDKQ